MLVEAAPWDVDDASADDTVVGVSLGVNMLFIVIALFKGRIILGILGFMVPLLAIVAALRLARPRSPWARRFYRPGSRRRRAVRAPLPRGPAPLVRPAGEHVRRPPGAPGPRPGGPRAGRTGASRPGRGRSGGPRRRRPMTRGPVSAGKLPGMAQGSDPVTTGTRRLVLLRHAKSAWPDGVPDTQRPLNNRGRRDARAAGQWLRENVGGLGAVVCSPPGGPERPGRSSRPSWPTRRRPSSTTASTPPSPRNCSTWCATFRTWPARRC